MSKVGYVINYAGYGTDVDKEWMKRFGCTEIMEEKQECGPLYVSSTIPPRRSQYRSMIFSAMGSSSIAITFMLFLPVLFQVGHGISLHFPVQCLDGGGWDTIIQACDGSSLYPFVRNFSLHGRM